MITHRNCIQSVVQYVGFMTTLGRWTANDFEMSCAYRIQGIVHFVLEMLHRKC